jgi:Phosphotransferase enzyme family
MRALMDAEDLAGAVRDSVGAGRGITGVERLRGGSKKGVYRVRLSAGEPSSVIVYCWAGGEDFWPAEAGQDATHPFAHASGLAPFLAALRALDAVGARTPRLLSADGSRLRYAADVAVVEDVTGGTLEALLAADPDRAAAVLADLARSLRLMRGSRAPRYGRVDLLERGGTAPGTSCEQLVLDRALRDLGEAARRDARIEAARPRIGDRLRELRERIAPRAEYGLIHGELGPDHVMAGDDGRAVLIDIEGLMHFDAEWEHVFLRLRFGEHYTALEAPGLDLRRLDLYRLAMRLSLVAGPLRLLEGDFPDRDSMRAIAEHNVRGTLALVAETGS